MKFIKIITIIFIIKFITFINPVFAASLWKIESIDTMKFSRDISREPDVKQRIPGYVQSVAALKPTHIAIATPYNEEFYPVLKTWVEEARKHNLKIWFRGNWSEWEGWFGYAKFKDYREHHQKTYEFMINHPELFEDGDIFTPAPEPENGGLGDPRGSADKTRRFQEFLIESYNTCEKARKELEKNFECGYFSTNGDVARESLTADVVSKIGNVVVIDHYVKTPERLVNDIKFLNEKYHAPIVLGEFGAPIPDIHGEMSENEQAAYISNTLSALLPLGEMVKGINYWTAFGGSTRLFENDRMPRRVAETMTSFYAAPILKGVVSDQFGNRIEGATISVMDGAIKRVSNFQGLYEIPLPGTLSTVLVSKDDQYKSTTFELGVAQDLRIKNITLERKTTSIVQRILLVLKGVISKFGVFAGQN